jgi:hypothetical protein
MSTLSTSIGRVAATSSTPSSRATKSIPASSTTQTSALCCPARAAWLTAGASTKLRSATARASRRLRQRHEGPAPALAACGTASAARGLAQLDGHAVAAELGDRPIDHQIQPQRRPEEALDPLLAVAAGRRHEDPQPLPLAGRGDGERLAAVTGG